MISVAAPVAHFEQQPEIFETHYQYSEEHHEDQEMAEYDDGQNEYDDQDMYNAEIESTVVEPPQSDIVVTHAPSTIIDEMEYLEEADYEDTDPTSKASTEEQLVQESVPYKTDLTAQTPPALATDEHLHPQVFSPATRMIPHPRPSTPLLSTLGTTTTEAEPVDDDWPICLYTSNGQEYMLFRSDGDTEALFEDNWLKSQPLETLFSSIRQTLENELASLTTSFAMEEIVLSIPDLDVSIAEDNCYTRDISLQDLVNLINSLCTKNGTERGATCRIHLSFQPRFIARFNQLVSFTSQPWDASKAGNEGDEHEAEGQDGEVSGESVEGPQGEEQYEEYEGDENAEEVPEYEEEEGQEGGASQVKFADEAEQEGNQSEEYNVEVEEFYEEDEEAYDLGVRSTEALVNDDHVVEGEAQYEPEEYDDVQGEENHKEDVDATGLHEQQAAVADVHGSTHEHHWLTASETDDLISYEEAVDQGEDGQDYRQQYIAETTNQDQPQADGGEVVNDVAESVSQNGAVPTTSEESATVAENDNTDANVESPRSKRRLAVDPSGPDQVPPSKRAKS